MQGMSLFTRFPATRWLVPAAAVAVLLGGTTLIRTAVNSAATTSPDSLPQQTTAQLISDVASADVHSLSGTIVQTSNLGIPDLPGLDVGGGGSSSLVSLLSGTHTLRIWVNSADQQRLSLLSQLGETDVIHNGQDLWIWSSKDNSASHRTLSKELGSGSSKKSAPLDTTTTGADTPQAMADLALKMISPSTTVSMDANDVVAGRPAYELVLQPKDTRSLISKVRIAIDGTEHLPLRVQVLARNVATPAVDVAFTDVNFAQPDAAEFTFNPPAGASVTNETGTSTAAGCVATRKIIPGTQGSQGAVVTPGTQNLPTAGATTKTVGSGWTTVLVAAMPDVSHSTPAPSPDGCAAGGLPQDLGIGSLGRITAALPAVSGSWGSGHLLSGTIVSVVVTADGRLAAGAVPPAVLYAALGSK